MYDPLVDDNIDALEIRGCICELEKVASVGLSKHLSYSKLRSFPALQQTLDLAFSSAYEHSKQHSGLQLQFGKGESVDGKGSGGPMERYD